MIILALQIALKFYRGSINESLTNFVSWISVISVAGSIAIAIITLSIINGFMYEFNKRILSIIPHIEIKLIDNFFIDWSKILIIIQKLPNIIYADFYMQISGIIEHNDMWHVIHIRSIDVKKNISFVNELTKFISYDDWKCFCNGKDQIILGKGVANSLNIKKGDWITILISHFSEIYKQPFLSKKIRVCVSSILDLNSQLDQNLAIMSFQDIQLYRQKIPIVDGIMIKTNDIFSSEKIAQEIKKIVPNYLSVRTWIDIYGYIFRDIQMVKIIIYLSMIFMVGISCFNIVSTLIIAVKNKNYDIAILYVLGANKALIKKIFFIYGFIIYLISSMIGVLLGVLISFYITFLNNKHSNWLNEKIMEKGIYFINFLPVQLSEWDIFKILGIIYLIAFLSIWYAILKIDEIKLNQILR